MLIDSLTTMQNVGRSYCHVLDKGFLIAYESLHHGESMPHVFPFMFMVLLTSLVLGHNPFLALLLYDVVILSFTWFSC